MFTPSSGDTRRLATQALWLNCGIRMTRPRIVAGSRSWQSRLTETWPSYSLPWVPPNATTFFSAGPFSPLITVIGIRDEPQFESI